MQIKYPKEHWLSQKFGKLQLIDKDLPDFIHIRSNIKHWFKCECGNEINIIFYSASKGHSKSCGRCNYKPKEHWLSQKFGKLQLIDKDLPDFIPPFAHKKFLFRCDCGNERILAFDPVVHGNIVTCSNCSAHSKEYWLSKTFKSLRLIDKNLPPTISAGTPKQFLFKCICGNEKMIVFKDVIDGKTRSCRQCTAKDKDFWLQQKYGLWTLLDTPELPESFPPTFHGKIWFKCRCGTKRKVAFSTVNIGDSQSCGCTGIFPNGTSRVSKKMFDELKLYLPKIEFSVRNLIGRREIDIYDCISKTAIEYNGLAWHSSELNSARLLFDFKKYTDLKALSIHYIGIFSDEWTNHKDIFLNLILNACGYSSKSKRIYDFEIKEVSQKEFQIVHDKFHYLSGRRVSATKYLLAYYKGIPIGGWSFKKVDENILDWNRAFWDHTYKAWNPHSKALEWVRKNMPEVKSVITFSDNRLFDGSMYQKLGFIFIKEVKPDYEYTDGYIRKHKFNFRVKAGVGEELEAQKKGFYRIYDCGKTKWELKLRTEEV